MTTEQEEQEMLRDCGTELAANWMRSAASTAETGEQCHNQMTTLYWAAIHILGNLGFNTMKNQPHKLGHAEQVKVMTEHCQNVVDDVLESMKEFVRADEAGEVDFVPTKAKN